MKNLDILLLNTNILITPLLIYLVYVSYVKVQDKKEEKLIFKVIIYMQMYLIFKYAINLNKNLLLIDIPLLLAYFKKEKSLVLTITIINIIYNSFFYETSLLIIAVEYMLYYLIIKKTKIEYFWIIKIIYTTYYAKMNIETFIIPILLSYLSIYVLKNTEEIMNLHSTIKKITKQKQIKTSLFKITHEIKNPIAVCKGYLDMYDEKNEESKNYIPIIKEEIDRVLVLLEDFLSMNSQKIKKEIIDINLLLEEAINNMKLLFKNKKIKLDSHIIDDEIYINADYNRLTQVLVNLLKNSIEALETKKNPIIKIWTELKKEKIKIHIKDNGVGINKDKLKKIKEPFYTTKPKGTGLGVALSNEIIKAHKGTIKYISEENKYTEVIITLPLEKAI